MTQQIEFLLGGYELDESLLDVIDTSRRRSRRRHRPPGPAIGACAVLIVGLLWVSFAAPSTLRRVMPALKPAPAVADGSVLGPPITSLVSDAVAAATGAGRVYVARVGAVTALNASTGRVAANTPVPELASYASSLWDRLVLDEVSDQLWLVNESASAPATEAIEFDASTLRRLATIRLSTIVQTAVVLDGNVYLASASGIRELEPTTEDTRSVAGPTSFITTIAADPTRHQLLFVAADQLIAEHPDGQDRIAVTLDLADADLSVVDGAIWLAGDDADADASIVQLDPHSLTALRSADQVALAVGSAPRFVAAGNRTLWIRAAGDDESLWCMNAATGSTSDYVPHAAGLLATADPSAHGRTFAVSDGEVRPLTDSHCP